MTELTHYRAKERRDFVESCPKKLPKPYDVAERPYDSVESEEVRSTLTLTLALTLTLTLTP